MQQSQHSVVLLQENGLVLNRRIPILLSTSDILIKQFSNPAFLNSFYTSLCIVQYTNCIKRREIEIVLKTLKHCNIGTICLLSYKRCLNDDVWALSKLRRWCNRLFIAYQVLLLHFRRCFCCRRRIQYCNIDQVINITLFWSTFILIINKS